MHSPALIHRSQDLFTAPWNIKGDACAGQVPHKRRDKRHGQHIGHVERTAEGPSIRCSRAHALVLSRLAVSFLIHVYQVKARLLQCSCLLLLMSQHASQGQVGRTVSWRV